MDPMIFINEPIDVVASFRSGSAHNVLAVPRKMRFRGRDIKFTIFGMRHPTAQGHRMIHVFDMSDGTDDYRLEFDAEKLTWILVAVIPGGSASGDGRYEN